MKVRSNVRKKGKKRKVVEIPKAARDDFEDKEEVYIEKVDGE